MYKLVIVEDEQDVRNRLTSMIEKSGCNFEIIAEYETGIDAYDGIISDNPDLILTDIKIPYINGIELSKRIREVYPLVRIIIVSGYSEFDFAKEAANLGVIGFISKPVTLESFRSILQKAEASLDNEFLTVSNLSRLSAFYQDNLPIIRENELYRLSNMSHVTSTFEHRLRGNNISLDYPCFAMCVFDFDELPEGDAERYDIVFSSIRKSIGDELKSICDYDVFNRHDNLCLILKFRAMPDIQGLGRRVERIIARVSRFSDISVSAGISSVYQNDKNFSSMVKEAMRALEYRSVIGGGKVFFFGNTHSLSPKLSIDDDMIKELGYILHSQTTEDCLQRIDLIRNNVNNAGGSHYYAATCILNILFRGCDDLEELHNCSGDLDTLYRRLFEIKTDDEIYDYLMELVKLVKQLNDCVIVDNVERNLRLVTSYMQTHFCDPDISFEALAKELGFSVSYISALLKKRLNTSFVKMLTELRMEKAKELLLNPTLKIIDIAEQLGYNDSYYFSHCFKKHVGVPPKEFRNEQNK